MTRGLGLVQILTNFTVTVTVFEALPLLGGIQCVLSRTTCPVPRCECLPKHDGSKRRGTKTIVELVVHLSTTEHPLITMMRSLLLFLLPVSAWATYDWTCNLHCYNDGECKHGKGKFGSYAGVEEEEEMPWEKAAPHPVGMYCSCPIGYTGLQCEIHMKTCGNDEHTCFNGAPCGKERAGDGTTWWRCECDPTDSVMDADYAGRYCEHIATIFCNNNPDDIGHEGTSYCTNGGKCKEKDHEGQK